MLNEFQYLPVLISAALTFLVLIFLIVIMARKTANVSFVFFLALVAVITGLVFAYIRKDPLFLYLMLLLASILMLPYAILRACMKKDEKGKKTSSKLKDTITQKRLNIVYDDQDVSLLDVNKGFINTMAESFNNPQGLTPLLDSYGKKILELTHADGAISLVLDDFEDILNVKSVSS